MNNFAIGDTVALKSGGPTMTIQEIGEYGYSNVRSAKCQWFDEGGKASSEIFPLASLEKA